MKCLVCPDRHDVRPCEMVNGSIMALCGFHRQRHGELISQVPMTDDEVEDCRDPSDAAYRA